MNFEADYQQAVTKLDREINSFLAAVHNFQHKKKTEDITQNDVFLMNDIINTLEAIKKRIEP